MNSPGHNAPSHVKIRQLAAHSSSLPALASLLSNGCHRHMSQSTLTRPATAPSCRCDRRNRIVSRGKPSLRSPEARGGHRGILHRCSLDTSPPAGPAPLGHRRKSCRSHT
eukprot:CAMPEP_0172761534 /NCGR_PEP_ID=MMETSP1074-20121228/171752_1 /TAXON_ID=2916 /ORGANISM="Ceratium fusus, Strain PA161109" /LENGTH=109 /DNA_ID=CAMNT_0013595763 /DNA_START=113 /DNA_END=438 /DNA_ORIENTATION=+